MHQPGHASAPNQTSDGLSRARPDDRSDHGGEGTERLHPQYREQDPLRHEGKAERGGTTLSRFPEQDSIGRDQK